MNKRTFKNSLVISRPQCLRLGLLRVQVKAIWPRFMVDAVKEGSELTNLLPSHTSGWWPLVEDVFQSPACSALYEKLLTECVTHEEFTSLSVDGTFRCCFPIMGQAKFNASSADKDAAAFGPDDSIWRLITVRGRTGAVVAMFPAASEAAPEIVSGLQEHLPAGAFEQVRFVASDSPSAHLFCSLKRLLPSLEALSQDPIHLAMAYEQVSGGKRTAGSSALRKCLRKFISDDPECSAKTWGPFFTGERTDRQNTQEVALRQSILDGDLSKRRTQNVLSALESDSAWKTPVQFIECIAAISSAYRHEVQRKIASGKRLNRVLWAATDFASVQWLFNNLRVRHSLSAQARILLPAGTTTNESLHAEVNNWFRQTQMLHQSTFRLKLRVMCVAKLLPHNRALYSPTARQMPAVRVLAHALGQGLWTDASWAQWAESGKIPKKARLPLNQRRCVEVKKVRASIQKKPALKRPSACKRPAAHRTPCTLRRLPGVRRAGVHTRQWLRCAPSAKKKSLQNIGCRCLLLTCRVSHL